MKSVISRPFLLAFLLLGLLVLLISAVGQSIESGKPPPSHALYSSVTNIGYGLVLVIGGWLTYPMKVLPAISVDRGGLFTAIVCAALFVPGLHLLCRWLYRHQLGCQPLPPPETNEPWRFCWSLSIAGIVMVLFAAGISMVGATHQFVWLTMSRTPAFEWRYEVSRGETVGNLRTVATYTRLIVPPPEVLHSWQTRLIFSLRYHAPDLDLTRPWDDPRNAKAFRLPVRHFLNPDMPAESLPGGYAPSHLSANRHLLGSDESLALTPIPDGESQTLLLGQAATKLSPWGKPGNARDPGLGINASPDGFGAPGMGALMVMCDGSVRFFPSGTDPAVLRALATPAGGEAPCQLPAPRH